MGGTFFGPEQFFERRPSQRPLPTQSGQFALECEWPRDSYCETFVKHTAITRDQSLEHHILDMLPQSRL
jgi:hypothetical protein